MPQLFEFVSNHWDLFLALVIIVAMLVFPPINRRLKGYKEVEPNEAVGLMNHQDAVLLDVRENSEYAEGHIQNSVHIPLSALDKQMAQLESARGKPVVIGCRSGHRSARACGMLRKAGFEQVYNLRGGVMAWQSAGLPLTKGGKKKKRKGTPA